ncbi:MAG TPA: TonB-dependent receptor [Steroidobacteraceae bacterium]|jgi:iron complex outermembrane receptor protein|nr:TonB-dependent receptor [Steroidobacteraceae bacterium]
MRSTRTTGRFDRGVSSLIVRATVASLLCLPVAAQTFAADTTQYQLSIPAQPLRTALQDFARQSGIDVLVSSRITQSYDAPVLKGRYTPVGALRELLKGTGLTFRQLDDETIEVQPAQIAQLVRAADIPLQTANTGGANLYAQNNAAVAQTPTAPPAAAGDNGELTEVIVTGSRIARPDYTSLSPIVTVDTAAIQNHSDASVVNALQNLPQFNVAGNSNNLSAASNPFPSATAPAPGAATVDLRGLGTNRTLVLIDGRRAQPVDALLEIDLNTIPPDAVQTIETITGGAASTYGADAIAGVVNIKLKQNFQGFEVDAQQGLSQYGDAANTSVGAIMGGNFADNKGNVMLVLDYSKVGQADQTKRGWFQAGEEAPGTPGGALYNGPNLTEFIYAAGNMPTGAGAYPSPAVGSIVGPNGQLFNQYAPLATGYSGPLGLGTGYKINPDGELGYNNQIPNLQLPQNRWQALATGHYNISDSITAYVQAQFSKTYVVAQGPPSGLFSVWSPTIPYGPWDDPASPNFGSPPAGSTFNPVPQALANLLNSRPTPNAPWELQGSTSYLGPYSTDTTNSVYQLTTGLRGEIPGLDFAKDWTWDVYGETGQSNQNAQLNGFPNFSRLQTVLDSNLYGQNWTNTQYPISVGGGCTSGLPIFTATGAVNTATSVSANCNAYVDPALNNVTTIEQNVYEGDLQGSIIDMPFNAGKLRFALGADYRQEQFTYTPDSGYTALQAYPEIVQNIALPSPVTGQTGASEVYTEFSIPIVKDLPFAKSIEIDPGIRFSDYTEASQGVNYSSSGRDVKTWKLLGNWVMNDWVNVRGGLEVANRAPNIAELFTPLGGSALTTGYDPCAVYPGVTPSYGNVAGNPNRYNVQAACEYLIEKGGAPASVAAALMTPGGSANSYEYNVFGPSPAPFPFVLGLNSGNPDLKSEVARTVTAGIVLNSPFQNPYTQRLRMSVDWYQIQINGAIGVPTFGQVYQECLDAQYNSLIGSAPGTYTGAQLVAGNPYCQYINREYAPAAGDFYGAPRNYVAPYVNQGGIQSRGIDLELDWGLRFSDTDLFRSVPGGISVNVVANYLDRYAVSPFQGAAYINYTGTVSGPETYYRDHVLSTFGYSIGPANLGFRWEHLPPAGGDPTTPGTSGPLNAYNEVDFFASYALTDALTLRFGIDNLMNAWPVWVGASAATTAIGTTDANYDTVGRRFYLGAKAKL